jgi:ABC-type uncharacterized transport system permease subunit
MLNKVIAVLLDKLKAKNPILFVVVASILGGVYYVLSGLETQIGLPGWLSTAIPYLKGLVALLGLGLNAPTYAYTRK